MAGIQTCPMSDPSYPLPIVFVALLSLMVSAWMIMKARQFDWSDKRGFKLAWDLQAAVFILIAMFCLYSLLDWYWLNPKLPCQHLPLEYLSR